MNTHTNGEHCRISGKVVYHSPESAKKRAKEIRRQRDERLNVYRCKCGKWHLGH